MKIDKHGVQNILSLLPKQTTMYSLDWRSVPFPVFSLVRETWSTRLQQYRTQRLKDQRTALIAVLPRLAGGEGWGSMFFTVMEA
jgi:hypothetical protein